MYIVRSTEASQACGGLHNHESQKRGERNLLKSISVSISDLWPLSFMHQSKFTFYPLLQLYYYNSTNVIVIGFFFRQSDKFNTPQDSGYDRYLGGEGRCCMAFDISNSDIMLLISNNDVILRSEGRGVFGPRDLLYKC